MRRAQRVLLVTLVALGILVYTFQGTSGHGNEWHINIDLWGFIAFLVTLVVGVIWIRRSGRGDQA